MYAALGKQILHKFIIMNFLAHPSYDITTLVTKYSSNKANGCTMHLVCEVLPHDEEDKS